MGGEGCVNRSRNRGGLLVHQSICGRIRLILRENCEEEVGIIWLCERSSHRPINRPSERASDQLYRRVRIEKHILNSWKEPPWCLILHETWFVEFHEQQHQGRQTVADTHLFDQRLVDFIRLRTNKAATCRCSHYSYIRSSFCCSYNSYSWVSPP